MLHVMLSMKSDFRSKTFVTIEVFALDILTVPQMSNYMWQCDSKKN